MVETITKKYIIQQVFWDSGFEKEIQEIYRMLKDQERKIFDLTFYDSGLSIMDYVEKNVRRGGVFIAKYGNDVCAMLLMQNPRTLGDVITRADVHIAVRKTNWGKGSREIVQAFKDYIFSNYYIKKLVASVPQNNYPIIKLLKDVGFTHEGTLKDGVVYNDKNGNPKYYDELIYSLNRKEV